MLASFFTVAFFGAHAMSHYSSTPLHTAILSGIREFTLFAFLFGLLFAYANIIKIPHAEARRTLRKEKILFFLCELRASA